MLLCISGIVRLIGTIYQQELSTLPNLSAYDRSNIVQIIGSVFFLTFSFLAVKSQKLNKRHRILITLAFIAYLLSVTFNISYIYSLHNVKNTLTVFLLGIVIVSIFFTLKFSYSCIVSGFVILLFIFGAMNSELPIAQKLANVIAGIILAFVLYSCSRYNYFIRSQHFVQINLLEEKNEEIQGLNVQKGEILGFVAHDLRNPLNNIEALSTLMLTEQQDAESAELQLILASAQHAKAIINDLIEVVQEKKTTLEMQRIDLVNYMRRVCEGWQANVERPRKINFSTLNDELIACINPSKFARVIDNLIGNGIKFSGSDSPINIELLSTNEVCSIRIRDFGIGIPEHLKALLFDQFSKAGRVGLNGEKSMGLGLHISKDIIEQHGGTLVFETVENEGTTFIISVPKDCI